MPKNYSEKNLPMSNDLNKILPEFEPNSMVWISIRNGLDFDKILAQKTKHLPEFEPKNDSWAIINKALKLEESTPKVVSFKTFRWAASAAILIGFVLFFIPQKEEGIITYSIEKRVDFITENSFEKSDLEAEAYINQYCDAAQYLCLKPEIKELRSELAILNQNQSQIEEQINRFGDDPDLVKAQIKVINHRSKITKELILLLKS
jgi:hypothetical protein